MGVSDLSGSDAADDLRLRRRYSDNLLSHAVMIPCSQGLSTANHTTQHHTERESEDEHGDEHDTEVDLKRSTED